MKEREALSGIGLVVLLLFIGFGVIATTIVFVAVKAFEINQDLDFGYYKWMISLVAGAVVTWLFFNNHGGSKKPAYKEIEFRPKKPKSD